MQNKNFRYIDDWAVIRLADSFVKVNKSGTGNGEAALYLGSKRDPDIFRFFGCEDFDVLCLMTKEETLGYLDEVECEYRVNRFNYKNEVSPATWKQNYDEVTKLPEEFYFHLTRKRQFDKHGRVYAQELSYQKQKDLSISNFPYAYVYDIIRRISIPEVSFLMLSKAEGEDADFHIKLYYDPNFE